MEMALGIFQHIHEKHRHLKYPFRDVVPQDFYGDTTTNTLMDIVSMGLSRCTKCYFYLDGIYFPLSNKFWTGEELIFILNHPYLLDKVRFILNNEELTQEKALEIIKTKSS